MLVRHNKQETEMEFEAPTLKGALSKAVAKYKKPPRKTTTKHPSKTSSAYGSSSSPRQIPRASAQAQRIGAIADFARNLRLMREADWNTADKYFHCVANCQASQRGPVGEQTAIWLSNTREWAQDRSDRSHNDRAADQAANVQGRRGGSRNPNGSCDAICSNLRPRGLPSRFWAD